MEKPGKKQPPSLPDDAVPGQPGPMAPPDHSVPWETDATVGLTQGESAGAEGYDSGDADLAQEGTGGLPRHVNIPPEDPKDKKA